jgi:hypothetical protein
MDRRRVARCAGLNLEELNGARGAARILPGS